MSEITADELQLLKNANRDMDWLSRNYSALIPSYNHNFVAVKNERIVAFGASLDSVLKTLENKGLNPQTTLVKYLSNSAVIL
ncbi:hypothetical protein HZC09_01150 [Candidatus Micrarchaeota archaeon]|nr:hypothetical protein [Candidatus Micrarchaeota archaeon]